MEKVTPAEKSEEFFEAVPYSVGSYQADDSPEGMQARARNLAIGTLIVLGVMVILLGLIVVQGFALIR